MATMLEDRLMIVHISPVTLPNSQLNCQPQGLGAFEARFARSDRSSSPTLKQASPLREKHPISLLCIRHISVSSDECAALPNGPSWDAQHIMCSIAAFHAVSKSMPLPQIDSQTRCSRHAPRTRSGMRRVERLFHISTADAATAWHRWEG
jgi:hypothetical protein